MHWTDTLARQRIPPDALIIDDRPCVDCGYNLRGALVGGICPECGRAVTDSLTLLDQPDEIASGFRLIAYGYATLIAQSVAVFAFARGGAFGSIIGWLGLFVLELGIVMRLLGVHGLRYRGGLMNMAFAPRIDHLWWITLAESMLGGAGLLASFVPALRGTGASFAAINALFLAWVIAAHAHLFFAARAGRALASFLQYYTIDRELLVAQILVLVVPLGVGAVLAWPVLRGGTSPRGILIAVVTGIVASLLATILGIVGMLHIANAAEIERDIDEDIVELPIP